MDFNKDDVISACLITTGKRQDEETFKKAEQYLISLQKSQQAWTIVYEILNTGNLALAVYAQAAILLKHKLQYDIYQLPQSEYLNIAQVIINLLKNHYHASITNPLSLALVLLYMHTFETLGDLIEILEKTLFNESKKEDVAISILKQTAEVVDDSRIIISKRRREEYITYLEETLKPKVFVLLDAIGKNQEIDEKIQYKVLDTFQEWFYFARKDSELVKNIWNHSCFTLALKSMKNPLLAEHARESINNIVKAVKNPEDHPNTFQTIFECILHYIDECKVTIKNDADHTLEYIKVFRCFGVKFVRTIITKPTDELLKFLEYMVELTSSKYLDSQDLIELEDFWQVFCEEFRKVMKKDETSSKLQDFQKLFERLILIALNRIEMNQEQLELMDKPDRRHNDDEYEDDEEDDVDYELRELEEKQEERGLARNILVGVQSIVGFEPTFGIIANYLQEAINFTNQKYGSEQACGWDAIAKFECAFYAAKSSIYEIPARKEEDASFNQFFQVVMLLEISSIKFNKTKIQLIEVTSKRLIVNEEIMSKMFYFLAQNLSNHKLEDEAGESLITMCDYWSSFVIKNFDNFLELRSKFEYNNDLIIALAIAIAYDTESGNRERLLAQLCKPFAQRIVEYAEQEGSDTDKVIIDDIRRNLRSLEMIFGKMPKFEDENTTHPLEPIFHELWPVIKGLFQKYAKVDKILLRLCKIIKKVMRAIGIKFKVYLVEYFQYICEIFKINPFSEFLYSIETSVSIFGKLNEMTQPLTEIYNFISEATLNFLNQNKIEDQDRFLEDFFGILFRYAKYIPSVILSSKTLETNLKVTEMAIGIDQPEVEKTLFLFLEYFIKLCSKHPQTDVEKAATEIIVTQYGEIFFKKLLSELAKYPEEKLRNYIIDIFFASFIRLKEHTLQWLELGLQQVEEAILSNAEKQDLLKTLNDIDVSNLKWKNKDDEETKKLNDITDKFTDIFEHFLYRCKLNAMRDYKLEQARI